ncbi:MAG: heat-inducible transcriptional repressor HrcA, partial [Caulobacterales bacterium]|nr:heat-inducible transcriptional repressor HrcA [Caulobacterales bacterium]
MTLADLDRRAREIFREIVEAYLETGEPVGSRTVSRSGTLSLSPASIRNTMSDLAQMGLLDAPHASAGRLPTHQGLRLFVDGLLEVGDIAEDERTAIDTQLAGSATSVEGALERASDLLSGLAGGAGMVVSPTQEAALRHVEFVALGPGEALAVLVFEDGSVENRLLATPPGVTPSALAEAGNYLSARLKGRTLAEARAHVLGELAEGRAALDAAARRLVAEGVASWTGQDADKRVLIVRGRANLLADLNAAEDLERVRLLFADLERKQDLITLLDQARDAQGVKIFIGAENPLFSLSGSSVIAAPYMNREQRIVGALGVIGPTRLNYARVIP